MSGMDENRKELSIDSTATEPIQVGLSSEMISKRTGKEPPQNIEKYGVIFSTISAIHSKIESEIVNPRRDIVVAVYDNRIMVGLRRHTVSYSSWCKRSSDDTGY